MRILIISIQITGVVLWTIFWNYEKGIQNLDFQDSLIVIFPYFLFLPTLYYLFTTTENLKEGTPKENLFSLWLKVRKKKLKDELEK